MLQNDLYTIIETAGNTVKIKLLPESAIYQGHFPGNPITPGVCQVGIVEELLRTCFGKKVTLREIKNLKFIEVLRPEPSVNTAFVFEKMEDAGNQLSIRGKLTVEERIVTKFSLVFEIES
ncbi:MAG: beta-hydroxyacyl-ACP dehydratase [Bacteroidales bacterium]|jgi:3-hydroxyacyl-[acyl-carrier-protein] dehydratase|nr:beta-hydroxyacyl-ACP dehydratase [Bacteroidales bacterium]